MPLIERTVHVVDLTIRCHGGWTHQANSPTAERASFLSDTNGLRGHKVYDEGYQVIAWAEREADLQKETELAIREAEEKQAVCAQERVEA